jgi:hypothetical protein
MRTSEILGQLSALLTPGRSHFEETVGALPGGLTLPGGTRVLSQPPQHERMQILPLSSTGTIAASTQASVINNPQQVFRPERLVTDGSVNFTIQDFKIGTISQFLATGSVPSALFAPGAFGVRLKGDTAQISMQVAVVVTNTDGAAAHAFNAAAVGPSVRS